MKRGRDQRYHSRRWQKLRLLVLARDGWHCWVDGCEVSAEAVDHIQQTSLEMPDALWFDMDNLRASCWRHNEWKARRKVEMEGGNQRRSFRAPMQQQTPLFSRPLPPPIRGSLSLTRTAYGRPATRTA